MSVTVPAPSKVDAPSELYDIELEQLMDGAVVCMVHPSNPAILCATHHACTTFYCARCEPIVLEHARVRAPVFRCDQCGRRALRGIDFTVRPI